MTREEFLTALDALVSAKRLLTHPFYQLCSQGKLTRETLREYVIEEERGAENHPALWRRFAAALGAAESDLASAPRTPEIAETIAEFRRSTREGSVAEGLAALYAYESQIPEVSRTKR